MWNYITAFRLAIVEESHLLKKDLSVTADMSSWKERFISESRGVKHATNAIVQSLENKADLQSHLYVAPTATVWNPAGLLPLHHILHKHSLRFIPFSYDLKSFVSSSTDKKNYQLWKMCVADDFRTKIWEPINSCLMISTTFIMLNPHSDCALEGNVIVLLCTGVSALRCHFEWNQCWTWN